MVKRRYHSRKKKESFKIAILQIPAIEGLFFSCRIHLEDGKCTIILSNVIFIPGFILFIIGLSGFFAKWKNGK